MWLAVSNVASVTEIFSHGHIPWSHHMSFSVWLCAPHHFAKKPKNTLLPAAISFYLGTDKDVNISNTDSTFLSLCVMLYSGPCSVSLQSRVTVVFSSLNHSPLGHMQHMFFTPLHALFAVRSAIMSAL